MQNEQTLIELGFTEKKEWYCHETDNKCFTFSLGGKIFIALVNYWEHPQYVTMGIFLRNNSKSFIVDRWRQCCSADSVKSYLNGK